MKAEKIMFATDFSEYSDAAQTFATSLARDSGALLVIVHVAEPPPHLSDGGFAGQVVQGEDELASERRLREMIVSDPSVRHTHKLLHGSPVHEIVKYASDENVDMIVIGSHGHRGLMRMLLGSVAEGVVRKATCPVVTIKHPSIVVAEVALA